MVQFCDMHLPKPVAHLTWLRKVALLRSLLETETDSLQYTAEMASQVWTTWKVQSVEWKVVAHAVPSPQHQKLQHEICSSTVAATSATSVKQRFLHMGTCFAATQSVKAAEMATAPPSSVGKGRQ